MVWARMPHARQPESEGSYYARGICGTRLPLTATIPLLEFEKLAEANVVRLCKRCLRVLSVYKRMRALKGAKS